MSRALHLAKLRDAVDAIELRDGERPRWCGRALPRPRHAVADVAALEPDLWVAELATWLYGAFYRAGRVVERPREQAEPPAGATPFRRALQGALRSIGSRADATARLKEVPPGESAPGFVTATLGPRARGEGALSRVYFDVEPEEAPRFWRSLLSALAEHAPRGAPLRVKLAADPSGYDRADTAVLYFPSAKLRALWPVLAALHDGLRPHLRDAVPVFTKPLARGVAGADDPGVAHESFGMHRCGLVARALVDAHGRGVRGLDARLAHVVATFEAEGLSIDAPHLRAGGPDPYAPFANVISPRQDGHARSRPRTDARVRVDLASTARLAARLLARHAIFVGGRATWLVARPSTRRFEAPASEFVDGGFDHGTLGVAFFLRILADATGDEAALALSDAALGGRPLRERTFGLDGSALSRPWPSNETLLEALGGACDLGYGTGVAPHLERACPPSAGDDESKALRLAASRALRRAIERKSPWLDPSSSPKPGLSDGLAGLGYLALSLAGLAPRLTAVTATSRRREPTNRGRGARA